MRPPRARRARRMAPRPGRASQRPAYGTPSAWKPRRRFRGTFGVKPAAIRNSPGVERDHGCSPDFLALSGPGAYRGVPYPPGSGVGLAIVGSAERHVVVQASEVFGGIRRRRFERAVFLARCSPDNLSAAGRNSRHPPASRSCTRFVVPARGADPPTARRLPTVMRATASGSRGACPPRLPGDGGTLR